MDNKIILINTLPRIDYWQIKRSPPICMPLGILSIATVLEKSGFEVLIVDAMINKDYLELIANNLEDCLFVGISCMSAGVASSLKISEYVKKLRPDIPIVWGGVHPTLFPEQTLKDPLVDIIVWGEGEYTCRDLAITLKNKDILSEVRGISFKSNGNIIQTPRREFIDISTLPRINYDLIDLNKYIYRDLSTMGHFGTVGSSRVKLFILNTGRGCPYKCTFCINTHPSQKYRIKPMQGLSEEIEDIVKKYDPDIIYLQDDLFFSNKERALQFLDQYKVKKYRFKWMTLARINYFCQDYLSHDHLKIIEDSCLWLGMGIESGSQRIRDLLRKEIDDEQIMRAIKLLAKYKIPTNYSFMVGLPFERKEEVYQTLSLIKKIKKINPGAEFTYACYMPYPGGELFEEVLKMGFHAPQNLREWVNLQDIETGFVNIKELPWIKNVSFINYLVYAVPHSMRRFKNKNIGFVAAVFLVKNFFKISLYVRTKFRLEGLYFELALWNLIRKMRQRITKFKNLYLYNY